MKVLKTLPVGSKPGEEGSSTKERTARRRLYDLHAWVGFHIAVIMVVVLFTGTFATISHELDWLVQPDMRVSPDGEKVSYEQMLDAVRAYDPNSTIVGISEMAGDYFAYRVTVIDGNATQQFIHVNQWTGEVTGRTPYFTIQRFFRDLHRYLYMPKVVGLTVVCSMAIILSISLYTGLKTSRNWRTLMTRIRFSKGARVLIGDAHKAAGLWSIWFFVLMIATGLWYYAEYLGKGFEPPVPAAIQEMQEIPDDVFVAPSADELIRIAHTAFPELDVRGLQFNTFPKSAIRVVGMAGNPIVRERANAVYIDPTSLEVLHVRRARDLPTVQWLNQIADPLHFGSFGGLPVKLIWFLFGLFMTGLSVSGVWLTWKRLKSLGASRLQLGALPLLLTSVLFASLTFGLSKQPILAGLSPFPTVWFIVGIFLAFGALFCLSRLVKRSKTGPLLGVKNAVLALLSLSMTAGAAHATLTQNPFAERPEYALGQRIVGPIRADLFLKKSADGVPTGEARFVIASGTVGDGSTGRGRLNLKSMTVSFLRNGEAIDSDSDKKPNKTFRLAAVTQPVYLKLPAAKLKSATEIQVTFEMRTGTSHTMAWMLPD
ncbi:MAG: PepSY-associated TM helix domain-containing protein [Pseudomonadota bacterium]